MSVNVSTGAMMYFPFEIARLTSLVALVPTGSFERAECTDEEVWELDSLKD